MAIWMEAGSEPRRDGEAADLKAISFLKQSALLGLKEKGNKYAKMGKMDYLDAIDCYARAINHKALDDAEQSTLYSNRAQLISSWVTPRCWRGNRTLPSKCQRFYLAVKASLSLNMKQISIGIKPSISHQMMKN